MFAIGGKKAAAQPDNSRTMTFQNISNFFMVLILIHKMENFKGFI